jgi:hypothetical protein
MNPNLRSCLARHVQSPPSDEAEVRRQAADAWHRHGVLLLRLDWIRSQALRASAEAIGIVLYGRRDR